ncbi:hypothetical protein CEE45_17750 [Candidatus Heimdallarchaeota archaeon B3_Heim]|nr:MAG: hypothetical protein CEE45_17750 [Candidatus Heimdallarchaeota archaeon B3_Heim]
MTAQQKLDIFQFKFSPKSRGYVYFCIGLILTGVVLIVSSNYSKSYSAYGGYEYSFGWDSIQEKYQFFNWGTIPQGLKGQKVDVLNRFTEDSEPGLGLHLLLMHGREHILQDEFGDWRTDISYKNLLLEAVHVHNLSFNDQKIQRKTISLSIPSDDAYIIIFLANSFSISENLTGTLIVDNYYLFGQDDGAKLLGTSLLITGILIGGITVFSPILKPFFRKKIFRLRNKDLKNSSLSFSFKGTNSLNNDERFRKLDSYERIIQRPKQNYLILLKYEFLQVFSSPFIIGFLPIVAMIILERFREVYKAWGPKGGYIFGEFGTTIVTHGITLFVFELSVVLVFSFLFLFREFDEDLHKIRLALPFSRKGYLFGKLCILTISAMFICVAFVGGTFIIIPLRNPTIGFQPITLIWVPFFAYGILSFVLLCAGFFLALILKSSRYTVMAWLGFIVTWFYLSTDLQRGFYPYTTNYLELLHQQETINSFFSIFFPERVIEFFLIRPLAPDWVLKDKLLFLYDTLIDPLIIIILQLLFALCSILTSFIIFRRRDL